MKFSQEIYDRIDPIYELLDDGSVRHRETLVVRPKFYSDLPVPFKVGQKAKVVDGSWQFPLGTIGIITHIISGTAYLDMTPICWERLDPVNE